MAKADIIIRDKTFSIACAEGQEDRLEALGQKFNDRIKVLEETIGDVGDMKLLVAAGISLIDDLEAVEKEPARSTDDLADLDNRITLIERTAAAALSEAATRIHRIADRVDEAS